jgi:hypothetical protein
MAVYSSTGSIPATTLSEIVRRSRQRCQRVARAMEALTEPAHQLADAAGGAPAPSLTDGTRGALRVSESAPSA